MQLPDKQIRFVSECLVDLNGYRWGCYWMSRQALESVPLQVLILNELQAGKGICITELRGVFATAPVLSPTTA